MRFFGPILIALFSIVHALYRDEAGIIDWHFRALGERVKKVTRLNDGSNGVVVVGDYAGSVNLETGLLQWRSKLSKNMKPVEAIQSSYPGFLVLTDKDTKKLLVLSAADGKLVNQLNKGDLLLSNVMVLDDGSVAIASSQSLDVYAAPRGARIWSKSGSFSLLGEYSAISNNIYAVEKSKKEIQALDALTGNVTSTLKLNKEIVRSNDNGLFVSDSNGVYEYVVAKNELQLVYVDGKSSKPLCRNGGNIVVSANDQSISFVSNQKVIFDSFALGKDERVLDCIVTSDDAKFLVLLQTSGNVLKALLWDGESVKSVVSNSMGKLQEARVLQSKKQSDDATALFDIVAVDEKFKTITGFQISIKDDTFPQSKWVREESLYDIVESVFVELPEPFIFYELKDEIAREEAISNFFLRYIARIKTHLDSIVVSLRGSTYLSGEKQVADNMIRDKFGLKKLVILLTRDGQIFALHTESKEFVWKKRDLFSDLHCQPSRMIITESSYPPVISVVCRSENVIIIRKVNGLTGEVMAGKESRVKGCKDVLKHSNDNNIALLCVPSEAGVIKAIGEGSFDGDSLHYYKQVDDKSLEGLHGLQSVPIWRFRVPKDEFLAPNIVAMNRESAISSVGRVLGNRTVLFKYLNPNMIGFFGMAKLKAAGASLYLLDSVSGKLLYHGSLPHALHSSLHLVLSENSVLVSYWSTDQKRTELLVIDLYDSPFVDRRVEQSPFSFLKNGYTPHAQESSFAYGENIVGLGVSSSLHGIAWKPYFLATESGFIQQLPRRMADSRRPKSAKLSADDQEELLVPYSPVIATDAKAFVTHSIPLMFGSRPQFLTSATLLESTNYLLVTGYDAFLTRISPSGTFDQLSPEFDKSMIIGATLGLWIGIVVIRMLLERKQLRDYWSQ